MAQNWGPGDRFKSFYGDGWYTGTVLRHHVYYSRIPESPWNSLLVRWDNPSDNDPAEEPLSPWDLDVLTEEKRRSLPQPVCQDANVEMTAQDRSPSAERVSAPGHVAASLQQAAVDAQSSEGANFAAAAGSAGNMYAQRDASMHTAPACSNGLGSYMVADGSAAAVPAPALQRDNIAGALSAVGPASAAHALRTEYAPNGALLQHPAAAHAAWPIRATSGGAGAQGVPPAGGLPLSSSPSWSLQQSGASKGGAAASSFSSNGTLHGAAAASHYLAQQRELGLAAAAAAPGPWNSASAASAASAAFSASAATPAASATFSASAASAATPAAAFSQGGQAASSAGAVDRQDFIPLSGIEVPLSNMVPFPEEERQRIIRGIEQVSSLWARMRDTRRQSWRELIYSTLLRF
jgi:hypothetical protein